MPTFVFKPNRALSGHPIVRRGRLIGTLRSPKYKERRRQVKAERLRKKAANAARRATRAAGRYDWKLQREAEANASTWRKRAKRLNPPPRRRPARSQPRPSKQALLARRLVLEQGIGIRYLPLIVRIVEEKRLALKPNTNLRIAVAAAIRPFNSAAADAFKAGKPIYLPRDTLLLETLLRSAETKPRRPVSSAKLKAQAKKERNREHLRELWGW